MLKSFSVFRNSKKFCKNLGLSIFSGFGQDRQRSTVTFPTAIQIYRQVVNGNSTNSRSDAIHNFRRGVLVGFMRSGDKANTNDLSLKWTEFLATLSSKYEDKEWTNRVTAHVRRMLPKTNFSQHLQLCEAILFSNKYSLKSCYPVMFDHHLYDRDMAELSPDEIERFMFFVYFYGSAPDIYLLNIETRLMNNIHAFGINQIGIVCLGFFHSNRRIKFELAASISQKLLENIREVSVNNMINILKTLRHANYNSVVFYKALSDHICQMDYSLFNMNQLMQIMFAYASLRMYQTDLLAYCAGYVTNYKNVGFIRTKDVAKVAWSFGTFHYTQPNLFACLLSMFRTSYSQHATQVNYPESVCEICTGCSFVEIYPHDLLDILFREDTTAKLCDVNLNMLEKRYQLLMLHHSVALENPDYQGNKLNKKLISRLPSLHDKLENEVMWRKGLQECYQTLQCIVGEQNVQCHFILPHFNIACIEMRVRENGRLQPINSRRLLLGPCDKKIAVVVLGYNQCAVDSNFVLGYSRTMLRQLNIRGYTVVIIYPDDGKRLTEMSDAERTSYITESILDKHHISHVHVDLRNTESQ